MNDFFDCMNVCSTSEHQRKRNPLLAPYQHADENRFDWLKNEFIPYLESWKSSINSRVVSFTDDERVYVLECPNLHQIKDHHKFSCFCDKLFAEQRIRVCPHGKILPG